MIKVVTKSLMILGLPVYTYIDTGGAEDGKIENSFSYKFQKKP